MLSSSIDKIRLWPLAVFAFLALAIGSPAQAELPAMKIGTAPLVSPTAAADHYALATTHTAGVAAWGNTRPPEIKELARGLGAGRYTADQYAATVFQYLYSNIETEFRYGLAKGALGALIDQSGTAFDQAHLMVELLREGGVEARYQIGTITLSATQFSNWTGITNATAACRLLADGGILATINGSSDANCNITGNVSTVTLGHIWVLANSKLYDPAYKSHTFKTGIDIAAAMSCGTDASPTCGSTIAALVPTPAPMSGAPTVNYVQGGPLIQTNIENQLKVYAQNLQTNLQTNHANSELDDIIGGARIDASTIPTPGASLPYTASLTASITEDIPNQYRTTLTVQFDNINQLLYVDEIYGRRLRIFGTTGPDNANGSTLRTSSLYLEYKVLATAAAQSNGTLSNDTLTLTVNHPYAAVDPGGSGAGSYMDQTIARNTNTQVLASGCTVGAGSNCYYFFPLTIVHGWGKTSQGNISHFASLQKLNEFIVNLGDVTTGDPALISCRLIPGTGLQRIPTNISGVYVSAPCLAIDQPTFVATYLAQNSRMFDLAGQINNTTAENHHTLGATTANTMMGSMTVDMEGAWSITSRANIATDRNSAIFSAASLSSRLEGSVAEQQTDAWDGLSGVSLLARASEKSLKLLQINSGNYDAAKLLLQNYPAFLLNETGANPDRCDLKFYVDQGYTIILPQNWQLGIFPLLPSGSGPNLLFGSFYAYTPAGDKVAFIVDNCSKGSGPTTSLDPISDINRSVNLTDNSLKSRKFYGVNTANGSLTLSPPTDLVTGEGQFPHSLSFNRYYNSAIDSLPHSQETVDSAFGSPIYIYAAGIGSVLGDGWTHNFQITADITSDAMQMMGEDSALDATWTIAAFYTMRALNRDTQTFRQHLGSVFVANWWGRMLPDNTVVVQRPPSAAVFARLPDGNFNPPPGSVDKLVQTGSRGAATVLSGKVSGYSYTGIQFSLTDKSGSVMNFNLMGDVTYSGNKYIYKTFAPQTWSFPDGTILTFQYSNTQPVDADISSPGASFLSGVTNNLGRSLSFALNINTHHSALITGVADGSGRSVTFSGANNYNGLYRVLNGYDYSVTAADGTITTYRYISSKSDPTTQRMVRVISSWFVPSDTVNPFMSVGYDTLYRTTSLTDKLVHQTSYYVGSASVENYRRGEIQDVLGNLTTTYFDEFSKPIQQIDPLDRVTTNLYDSAQRLKKTIYPLGNAVQYSYDNRHNLTETRKIARPGSGLADLVEASAYPGSCTYAATCNQPTSTTDANGNITGYTYNNTTGQPLTVTGPAVAGGAALTTLAYTGFTGTSGTISLLTSKTEKISASENTVTTYDYGTLANKRVLKSAVKDSGGLNLTTYLDYDVYGNVLKVTDPRGTSGQTTYTTQYAWDSMRRLTQKTDANGRLTKYTYNVDGKLIKTELQLGAVWQTVNYSYTPTGRQATITDPQSHVTTKTYDALDRLSYVTDAEGRKTRMVYDAAGQVLKEIRGWQGSNDNCAVAGTVQQCYAQYSYDDNGNKLGVWDANGNATTYAYNGHDRLAQATFPDASYEQYSYDNNGNTLTKRTRAGQTIATAYDAMNRLTTRTVPSAPTVSYGYDLASRQTSVTQTAAGSQPAYSVANIFDKASRLTSVNDNGRTVAYQYDEADNRTRVTWPDSYYVTYDYDPLNKVTTIKQSGTTTLASYTRDDLTRCTAATYGNGASTSYCYEVDNDLSTLGQTFVGSSVSFTFSSNNVHQVTSRTVSDAQYDWLPAFNDNTGYAPNSLNQYASVTKNNGYKSYSYDANGNLTSDGRNSYAYDAENKLVTASTVTPQVHAVTYQYDPLGRRFAKSVDGVVTQYLSDQSEEIAEYTSAGTLLRRYVYGPGVDEPVVRIEYNAGGTETSRYFHHMDAQGSVIAVTTSTGAVAERYVYDPYGNSSDSLTGNPIRYTGRRFDPETGLYYYRARYYSPTLGRFMQTDPIGYADNLNMYAYAGNDPLSFRDPTGMMEQMTVTEQHYRGSQFGGDFLTSFSHQHAFPPGMPRSGRPMEGQPMKGQPMEGQPMEQVTTTAKTCPAQKDASRFGDAVGLVLDAFTGQIAAAANIGGSPAAGILSSFSTKASLGFGALQAANNVMNNWNGGGNRAGLVAGQLGALGVGAGASIGGGELAGAILVGFGIGSGAAEVGAIAGGFVIGGAYLAFGADATNNAINNFVSDHTGGCSN